MRFQKAPKSMRSQTKTWHYYCGRGLTDAFKRVVVDQGLPCVSEVSLARFAIIGRRSEAKYFRPPRAVPRV